MSNAAPQSTPETAPPASQIAFQNQTNALAHHLLGLLIATQVPPVVAALAASQIIRAVLINLAKTNRDIAKALVEELAVGLVEFCEELGQDMVPDLSAEGQTKQ